MNSQGKDDGGFKPPLSSMPSDGAQQLESTFAPAPMSVPKARSFVLSADWTDDDDTKDRLAVITSELVTNAVLHARTTIRVRVTVTRLRIRVGVSDTSTRPAVVKSYGVAAPTGRGLHVVEALADRWGVDSTRYGKTVWFELDQTEQSA